MKETIIILEGNMLLSQIERYIKLNYQTYNITYYKPLEKKILSMIMLTLIETVSNVMVYPMCGACLENLHVHTRTKEFSDMIKTAEYLYGGIVLQYVQHNVFIDTIVIGKNIHLYISKGE